MFHQETDLPNVSGWLVFMFFIQRPSHNDRLFASSPFQDPEFPPFSTEQSQQWWTTQAGSPESQRVGGREGRWQSVERRKGWGGVKMLQRVILAGREVALRGLLRVHTGGCCMVLDGEGNAIPAAPPPHLGCYGGETYNMD